MKDEKKALALFELFTSMKRVFGLIKFNNKGKSSGSLESMILIFLKFNSEVNQSMIVDKLRIPKQTVSNVVTNLQNDNLVFARANEEDKRFKFLILTEDGENYANELIKPLMGFNEKIFDYLGSSKINEMIEQNKELCKAIEEVTKEE